MTIPHSFSQSNPSAQGINDLEPAIRPQGIALRGSSHAPHGVAVVSRKVQGEVDTCLLSPSFAFRPRW